MKPAVDKTSSESSIGLKHLPDAIDDSNKIKLVTYDRMENVPKQETVKKIDRCEETPTTPKRKPIPDMAAQRRSLTTIRDIYMEEYKNKNSLARRLLDKAKETQDVADRFVLFREAKDAAAEMFQQYLLEESIELLNEEYDVCGLELMVETLDKMSKRPRITLDQKELLVDLALKAIDEAQVNDNFDSARKLCRKTMQWLRPNNTEKELFQAVVAKNKEIDAASKAFEKVRNAINVLESDPDEPDANTTMGRYYCSQKDNWKKGLPMLLKCGDASLKNLAERDLRNPTSTSAQIALGNAWWDADIKRRSVYWYKIALPHLAGMEKDKIAKRLESLPTKNAVTSTWFDLLADLDVARDRNHGEWKTTHEGLMCARVNYACLAFLPIVCGDYDLAVSFTRNSGNDMVSVILPIGSMNKCSLCLSWGNGKRHGMDMVNKLGIDKNATFISPGKLENHRNYNLFIKVRTQNEMVCIESYLDNLPLLCWQGKASSLSLNKNWTMPKQQQIGIGGNEVITFHSVKYKNVAAKKVTANTRQLRCTK